MQNTNSIKLNRLLVIAWKERFMYLLLLPAVIATGIFCYWPMYGIIIAFKDYSLADGILKSPWAEDFGFAWFRLLFIDPDFRMVLQNTVIISFSKIVIGTFCSILFALLLSELRNEKYKKTIQSVMYLPYFLSWVVMAGIIFNIFTISGGVFNNIIVNVFHGEKIQVLSNPIYFRPLLYLTHIWKEVGFGTIIYLAAIAGVNVEQYESAIIDGASRFKRIWSITLPSIKGTITILLILSMSGIMSAGFDQGFSLYSPQVFEVGDIVDTYVFRHGIIGLEFSYTTAIDLFKQAINVLMLITANFIVKRAGEDGIF
jgi:putative aldouronate transport system permease protein